MNRRQLAIMLALLAAIAAFRLTTMRDGHPWGGDFAQYLQHAENIAEGRPYAETGYLYNPHWPDIGPPRYPPGLAIVLAPVYGGAEGGLQAVKVVMNLLALLLCVVIAFVHGRELPFRSRAALAALVGFSPALWEMKESIASEHVFMPLFIVALALCDRAWRRDREGRRDFGAAAVAGVVVYLSYATRTVGLLLVPALGLAALARTRRLGMTAFAAGTIAVILAAVQGLILPSGAGYLDQLSITAEQIALNARTYLRGFTYCFGGGAFAPLRLAAAAVFGALALVGYARRWRRGEAGTAETFAILYLFVLLTWRAAQGTRFLFPLIPLALTWALDAAESFGRRAGLVVAALCLIAGASYLSSYSHADWNAYPTGIGYPEVEETFEFIRDETPSDAVFVFRKPRVLAHYCARSSATLHDGPAAEQWAFLERIGADYLVFRVGVDEEWVETFVRENATRLVEVHANARLAVYAIR